MTKNSAEESESRPFSPSGKRSRPQRGGYRKNNFSWGEVDDVEQEEEALILPAKKVKKRAHKIEKIETTLTVENPQANLYQKKKTKRRTPPVNIEGLELPSYGSHLTDQEDDCSIFLRRAEEADRRTQSRKKGKSAVKRDQRGPFSPPDDEPFSSDDEPFSPPVEERSSKCRSNRKRPAARLSEPSSVSEEKVSEPRQAPTPELAPTVSNAPSQSNAASRLAEGKTLSSVIAEIRAKATGKLRQFGFDLDWIRSRVPRRDNAEDAILLLSELLDARLKLASAQISAPKGEMPADIAPVSPASVLQEPVSEPLLPAQSDESIIPVSEKKSKKRRKTRPNHPNTLDEDAVTPRPVFDEKEPPEPEFFDESSPAEPSRFGDIPLSPLMLESLCAASYTEPTPIQAGTIPRIMAGVDLLGQSKTGSGKTAAFMIPIIEEVERCEPGNDPVALVVVPTRELAVQIRDETKKLSFNRDLVSVACYGGKPIVDQMKKLRGGVDIVIGTPGRILDLVKRRALSLDHLRWVVLDEADRMLDIGFRPDIERILKLTPNDRQTLLFSATLPEPVVYLARRYMNNPEIYDFSENAISADTIEQFYMTVDRERKYEALLRLLDREKPAQSIVFCRTKRMVDKIGRSLKNETARRSYLGTVEAIHGDLSQSQRDRIMRNFRAGKIRLLVATDVVGRGIDVSGISHIINYDIPQFCDDYVHRVGRTGRMGREGVAYTLVTSQEGPELTRIEMRINRLLERFELEDFEAYTRPEDAVVEDPPKEMKVVYGQRTRRLRRAL